MVIDTAGGPTNDRLLSLEKPGDIVDSGRTQARLGDTGSNPAPENLVRNTMADFAQRLVADMEANPDYYDRGLSGQWSNAVSTLHSLSLLNGSNR
jgi:hypothetical protein